MQGLGHTLYGSLGGAAIGSSLEYFMPDPNPISNTGELLKQSAETLFQLGIGGYLSFQYFDFMTRRGVSPRADPSNNLAYLTTYIGTQPKLIMRLSNVMKYVSDMASRFYISDTSNAAGTTGAIDTLRMQSTGGVESTYGEDAEILAINNIGEADSF